MQCESDTCVVQTLHRMTLDSICRVYTEICPMYLCHLTRDEVTHAMEAVLPLSPRWLQSHVLY